MVLPHATGPDRVLRRVGLIGDIHCEDETLEIALEHLASERPDAILSVGDIVDGVGDPNRVCDLLKQHEVFTVMGNHDRWVLQDSMRDLRNATPLNTLRVQSRDWLAALPQTLSFETPRGELLLCHGLGENDMAMVREDDEGYSLDFNLALSELIKSKHYTFVANGHSHHAMVRTIEKLTIINAGTLARGARQICTVIDFQAGHVELFDIEGPHVVKAEHFSLP
jgi:putative phosphoesterase